MAPLAQLTTFPGYPTREKEPPSVALFLFVEFCVPLLHGTCMFAPSHGLAEVSGVISQIW
jgi:hypothetical protein